MNDAVETPDVRRLLRPLIGQTIHTVTGKPNKIIRLDRATVVVGTSKSPLGKPVEIEEIQAAVDRLFTDGEIEISVKTVGYRSAFIGAVLSVIPAVKISKNPRKAALINRA